MKEKVGWIETELGQVCSKIVDGTHHTPEYTETGIPFISVKDIYNEKVSFRNCRHVSYETHRELIKRCCPESNDLLITKSGTIGRMAIVPNKPEFSLFVSVALLKNYKSTIYSKFLLYSLENYLNSINISQDIKGGLLKNFHLEDIRITKINLAPLPEQRAIVSKIELLFSELDNGIANLKLAQAQLKVYRQAVLKKAFEGEFTKKWREQQADLTDAMDLLEQIRKEKEEAAKVCGKKVKPVNPLTEVELDELLRLPEEWKWVKVGELCDVVRGGSPRPAGDPKYYGGEIPFLKVADLTQNDDVYLKKYKYTIKEAGLKKTRLVEQNTLLLSNSGATLGVPKICSFKTTFNDGIAAFLDLAEESLVYHYYFWVSKTKELRAINQGAAQPNLNTDIIANYLFPFCSIPEQQAIVQEIETRLSVCDKIEQDIEENLIKAEALRQSILKKAFEGKLLNERELAEVRRAEDWEPAEVLLERIRAEKAEKGKK